MTADRTLIDAVKAAIYPYPTHDPDARDAYTEAKARAAVLAVADWLDPVTDTRGGVKWTVATILRTEAAPPPPPTPEDVIRRARMEYQTEGSPLPLQHSYDGWIAASLLNAGFLREDT